MAGFTGGIQITSGLDQRRGIALIYCDERFDRCGA
jgi:hypothetical protein